MSSPFFSSMITALTFASRYFGPLGEAAVPQAYGFYEGKICQESPCCPPADFVFPFSHDGNKFDSCTHDGLYGMWCGKNKVMKNTSRWDYCAPLPEDGICPGSTLQDVQIATIERESD